MKVLPLAGVLLALASLAFAADAPAKSPAPVPKDPEVATAAEEGDVLAAVLARCPHENRRAFLGSVKFLRARIVSFDYKSIESCLGRLPMKAVSDRLALVGTLPSASPEADAKRFGVLFSSCPAEARDEFFDSLTFQGRRFDGMSVKPIARCAGDRDLPLFLGLFGSHGLELKAWRKDCRCDGADSCRPDSGHYCRPGVSRPGR